MDRILRLVVQHRKLDRMIAAARHDRLADSIAILRLKKMKLAIRDQIARAARARYGAA